MQSTLSIVTQVAEKLTQQGLMLVTAESCTGGQVASMLTSLPGSSNWFERGFVTYSNQAKHEMLGVDLNLINQYGAVSSEVAVAMADGALLHSQSQIAVAITGIAGPTGGNVDKPVGTVWIAWAYHSKQTKVQGFHFDGDRMQVREAAAIAALKGIFE